MTLLWRRRAEVTEPMAPSEDPLGSKGGHFPLLGLHLGEVACLTGDQRAEELVGGIPLPCSLAWGQRYLLRAANLDAAFCCAFSKLQPPVHLV